MLGCPTTVSESTKCTGYLPYMISCKENIIHNLCCHEPAHDIIILVIVIILNLYILFYFIIESYRKYTHTKNSAYCRKKNIGATVKKLRIKKITIKPNNWDIMDKLA